MAKQADVTNKAVGKAVGKAVSRAARRTAQKPKAKSFGAAARRAFLDHLAQTANVSASARKAKVSTSLVYAERRKNEVFRVKWSAALAEGFAKLETELLAEALTAASGNIKDGLLKARAQKHRLALALLAAHRASVKGEKSAGTTAAGAPAVAANGNQAGKPTAEQMRHSLAMRITQMRERTERNSAE